MDVIISGLLKDLTSVVIAAMMVMMAIDWRYTTLCDLCPTTMCFAASDPVRRGYESRHLPTANRRPCPIRSHTNSFRPPPFRPTILWLDIYTFGDGNLSGVPSFFGLGSGLGLMATVVPEQSTNVDLEVPLTPLASLMVSGA